MEKTQTDNTLIHSLLSSINNLGNSIIEKNCEIINLKKEMKRLETLVSDLTEKNLNLLKTNIELTEENRALANKIMSTDAI
jgi:hypothetical protein